MTGKKSTALEREIVSDDGVFVHTMKYDSPIACSRAALASSRGIEAHPALPKTQKNHSQHYIHTTLCPKHQMQSRSLIIRNSPHAGIFHPCPCRSRRCFAASPLYLRRRFACQEDRTRRHKSVGRTLSRSPSTCMGCRVGRTLFSNRRASRWWGGRRSALGFSGNLLVSRGSRSRNFLR